MHRGRIQSQGGKIEKSKPWSYSVPIKKTDAIIKIDDLKKEHSKKEIKIRYTAFKKAKKFVEDASINNGVSATVMKTFMANKNDKHRRVDIEVRKGEAFIK